MNRQVKGHIIAFFTILMWGTTFIGTKILLRTFEPVEILVIRFVIGYIVLLIAQPRFIKTSVKQEGTYMLAALCGVSLYYMLENSGLMFTTAGNAGVIIAAAPFFTALLAHFISKDEPFKIRFFIGFAFALTGIAIISFNGSKVSLNPVGDLMMLGAALSWAGYSVLLKKVNSFGHNVVVSTRKIFGWGVIFILPCLPFTGFDVTFAELTTPINIAMFLFLGVGACAGGFVMWNYSTKIIGPVSANFYIYLTPVVTLIASALVLDEKITPLLLLGTVLTLSGLIISEWKKSFKKNNLDH